MDQRLSPNLRRLTAGLLLGTCLSPCPVWAADFIVSNNADSGAGSLRQAIISSNAAGGSNNIIINSGVGTITLTSGDLPTVANNATIVGNNNTLSGGNTFRGLFIGGFSGTTQTAVTVSVSDLTIANATAQGGAGGSGGGGGAGLGGALFVASQASLTVSNVNLTNNAAVGGNGNGSSSQGGGGGMGGNGGSTVGGGGGLGVGANGGNNVTNGQSGIATGASGGGDGGDGTAAGADGGGGGGSNNGVGTGGSAGGGGVGGGVGTPGTGTTGGAGGFGGGGGGGRAGGVGGAGGFGGGGGSTSTGGAGGFGGGGGGGAVGGSGGFGGGDGGTGGGGAAGLGGAVFVQQGGTFNIAGGLTINGGIVTAGAGAGTGGAGSAFGSGIFLQGDGTLGFAPASGVTQTISDVIADQTGSGGTGGNAGSWGLSKSGPGMLVLSATNTYTGGTTVSGGLINFAAASNFGSGTVTLNGGGLQWASGNTTDISGQLGAIGAGGATFDTNGNNVLFITALNGPGGVTKTGAGMLTFQAAQAYTGGTTVNAGTLFLDSVGGMLPVGGALTVNGGLLDMSFSGADQSVGALSGTGGQIDLGPQTLTTNSSANTTLATTITGTGGLVKQGSGILTLTGTSTFSGGTTISGGLVNFNALANFGTGTVTLNGGGLQWAAGTTTDISSRLVLGAAGATFDTNGSDVTFASGLGGAGGIVKQGGGILNLAGTNTYTGATSVTGGTLAVNGSITSNVTVGAGGTLGGTGTIFGTVSTLGTIAPGNSIGTVTVSGSFTQAAGSIYQVEANAAGQSDRINVTGAPGTATIAGGTVQVIATPGSYAASTTYTILNATGGVSGTYNSVTSNFAFLTPTLSYDPNNVFLTLALQSNAFSFGGNTPNQKAVGWALDAGFPTASGDFATVVGALAGLDTVQGPLALTAISGEPWADFGTMNINNGAMFMNAVGQQMANARNAAAAGTRVALAEACDVAVCEPVGPLSAWISGLGGLGSVLGDGNASTLTYNFGGAAVGMDYRLDPRFLLGLSAAYTSGTQWVNGFQGKGWTNSVALAAYGSFTPAGSLAGFYADALAGWANFTNQLQRQIQIPGLQPRQANGSTSANQFLGQVEAGYKLGVYAPAAATITPFARFAASSVMQNALSEWGASSLSLNVQQQTTNSLRTTVGAELGSSIGIGNQRAVDLALRLGWQHEFAYTGRPITAAFAGAPGNSFTVYGATPQPDAAVIGFSASTTVAAATQLYLRYDGEIGNGTDNHALNLGVRLSW